MKKTVFMALSAIALMSVSCNRDNNEPQTKASEKTTEQNTLIKQKNLTKMIVRNSLIGISQLTKNW